MSTRTLDYELRVKINNLAAQGMIARDIKTALYPQLERTDTSTINRWMFAKPDTLRASSTRRHLSDQHKAEAVAHRIVNKARCTDLARQLGISPTSIRLWVTQHPLDITVDITDYSAVVAAIMDSMNARRKNNRAAGNTTTEPGFSAPNPTDPTTPVTPPSLDDDASDDRVMFNGRSVAEAFNDKDLPDDPAELKKLLHQERRLRTAAEEVVVVLGKGDVPVSNRDKTTIATNLIDHHAWTTRSAAGYIGLARSTYYRLARTRVLPVIDRHAQRTTTVVAMCQRLYEDSGAIVPSAG